MRRAQTYVDWLDHGILRRFWFNFFEISPGVYRSNHPNAKRLAYFKSLGVSHILNLRGKGDNAPYLLEKQTCADLQIEMIDLGLTGSTAMPRESMLNLIATLKEMPRPFVMHCKSGADRTSLASAIYLMVIEGVDVATASKQLSIKYVHLKFSKKGILDYIIDSYAARTARDEISFEDWIATEYDHEALQKGFNQRDPITA